MDVVLEDDTTVDVVAGDVVVEDSVVFHTHLDDATANLAAR